MSSWNANINDLSERLRHKPRPEGLHAGQKGTKLTLVICDETTGSMEEVLPTLREGERKI